MASDGSDAEDQPFTPSKSNPKRPRSRHIIRWNDEKLVLAFCEFRLAAQRHRIDIRKALDDAAKTIGEHCTADALIQQLTKRRHRHFQENGTPASGSAPPTPTPATFSTPKRKTTAKIKAEATDAPSSVPASAGSQARASRTSSSRAKIKQEIDAQQVASNAPFDYESDSEYNESPLKTKKKRVRGKPRSAKKKTSYGPSSEEDDVDDEAKSSAGSSVTKLLLPSLTATSTPNKRMKTDRKQSFHGGAFPGEADHAYSPESPIEKAEPTIGGGAQGTGSGSGAHNSFNGYGGVPRFAPGEVNPYDPDEAHLKKIARALKLMDQLESSQGVLDPPKNAFDLTSGALSQYSKNGFGNLNGGGLGLNITQSPRLSPSPHIGTHSPHGISSNAAPTILKQPAHKNDSFSDSSRKNSDSDNSQALGSFNSPNTQLFDTGLFDDFRGPSQSFGFGEEGDHMSPLTVSPADFGSHGDNAFQDTPARSKLSNHMFDFGLGDE